MPTILCIGDSNTAGSDQTPGGYRTYRGTLYTLLVSAGIDGLDFIGPENRPPASGGTDGDCAAWGGARMDNTGSNGNNITDRLSSLKTNYPSPDLIVLWIGWNDVYQATASIATKFETLLDAIQAGAWASKKVVICTLHPEPGKTEAQTGGSYAEYGAINAKIRALANGTTRILADLAALSGADPSSFVEDLLADIQQPADSTTVLGGGRIQNAGSGPLISSWKSVQAFNALWQRNPPYRMGAGGSAAALHPSAESVVNGVNRYTTTAAALVPWLWSFCGIGHAATNTCIEVRNGFGMAKRVGGGWERYFQGARFGDASDVSVTLPVDQGTASGNYALGWRPDGITSWYKPDGNVGLEVWPRETSPARGIVDFYGGFNRDLTANSEVFACGAQVRLALINPNGVDDRAQARFLVKMGFDLFSSLGISNNYRYDTWGWPYAVMDGGSGRWKFLRSNEWTAVGCVSIGKGGSGSTSANSHFHDSATPPPLANWAAPEYALNDIPDYSISATGLRASPPPVPDYWEARGGTTNGYAEVDYWFNPGINARDIHLNQSGADKIAGVIARAIVSSGALGSGSSGGTIFSLLPGLPSKPNVFLKTASGKKNVEPKNRDTNSAPVWGPATGLPDAFVGTSYSAQLLATGTPSPTFSIVSGAPSWLSCSSAGVLSNSSAIPSGDATYAVTFLATNSEGSKSVTLTLRVSSALTITTASLPGVVQNQYYSATLEAAGPTPVTWSLNAGSGALPTGLSIVDDKILGTTSLGSGSFPITVRAEAPGIFATKALTLTVSTSSSKPSITTATLASGVQSTAYSATLAATGATPIDWKVSSGSLPSGWSLDTSTGLISGTSNVFGVFPISVTAVNKYGEDTRDFVIYLASSAAPAVSAPVSPWGRWIR